MDSDYHCRKLKVKWYQVARNFIGNDQICFHNAYV
ncbi:hypothetical protein ABIE50_006252 [Chitinophaga sp. OAE865]